MRNRKTFIDTLLHIQSNGTVASAHAQIKLYTSDKQTKCTGAEKKFSEKCAPQGIRTCVNGNNMLANSFQLQPQSDGH